METIPYTALALLAVLLFASIHLWAETATKLHVNLHRRLLSAGGGIAITYIFLDLLPKLSKNDQNLKNALEELFPYLERHVYIMALMGFLLFFIVDRSKSLIKNQSSYFWLSLSSYTLFNFFLGYAIVDKNNPEVQPLLLFTFAMGLHLFMNDFSLSENHGESYRKFGKWFLIGSLFLGWFIGALTELSATAIALVSGFIGGGVIMNVVRHELPEENKGSLIAFLTAAFIYAGIILSRSF